MNVCPSGGMDAFQLRKTFSMTKRPASCTVLARVSAIFEIKTFYPGHIIESKLPDPDTKSRCLEPIEIGTCRET